MIPNHIAPSLSALDMQGISFVPEGGNWKDIPESVPSKRLDQIRKSYAEGKGSRSTYYGRLTSDMPAYTISTNFTRPGCGCNTHYSQDRTITYREAARIQSFPDSFVFIGSKASVAKQIGNAVPPLLAYQIAKALPVRGAFIDLFSGAGGLALGFTWAGWTPIISNDIVPAFLETHKANIAGETICGDISDSSVIDRIAATAESFREDNASTPLFVLGGPPCQGFSTANYRSTKDVRNWLFKEYAKVLQRVKPDGFVFENVTGILNFEKGTFFPRIVDDLSKSVEAIKVKKLNCANFGVPQRRERVIVLGSSEEMVNQFEPKPISRIDVRTKSVSKITNQGVSPDTPLVTTVKEALSDLPPVKQGEDATLQDYVCAPANAYQRFMRGVISPGEYLKSYEIPQS
jgi:DNA (cytosine-5)-methyltransferase 1